MTLLARHSEPIGLDVGAWSIKAVQFSGAAGKRDVRAAACAPRRNPGQALSREEIAELRGRLAGEGFGGRRIVPAVPPAILRTGVLELPPRASGAPVGQLARTELARMHKWAPDTFEAVAWDLPAPARAANSTFAMAAGCTHADADALLDLFEAEGFQVEGLDIHACAVARACEPLIAAAGGTCAILDLGWSSSRLVLIHEGVEVYQHCLARAELGGFARELASRLGIEVGQAAGVLMSQAGQTRATGRSTPPDASEVAAAAVITQYTESLVKEMRIPLSYLANQYPDAEVRQVLLTGGGAMVPGCASRLAGALQVDVKPLHAGDLADCAESRAADLGCCLTVAMGLALYEEGQNP